MDLHAGAKAVKGKCLGTPSLAKRRFALLSNKACSPWSDRNWEDSNLEL